MVARGRGGAAWAPARWIVVELSAGEPAGRDVRRRGQGLAAAGRSPGRKVRGGGEDVAEGATGAAGAPPAIEFGIFDWMDRGSADLGAQYKQRLQMLEVAEELGFLCYHLAEHHGTPLGLAPSPSVFLAAAAERTRRIRLGPLVYLLSLYNPVRLLEEICMLDHLSGGRFDLGVGRGISPFELATLNVDITESRAIFHEALDVILQGLATGEIDHAGRYFTFKHVRVQVHPVQQPYPPLWYPTSNAETVPWIAEHGFHTIFGLPTLPPIREQRAIYQRIAAEHQGEPGRLNGHVAAPKLGLNRIVYVAATDERARAEAKAAYPTFFHNFEYLWALNGDHRYDDLADFDARLARGGVLVGSPETVRARVAECLEQTGCNYFSGAFAWGGLTTEQLVTSVRLFGEQVMPAFRAPATRAAVAP
jgi:alkanesulfonate monooxygenase SsuD/methylene tetrahydromethanopterin reductase-like flavin-dependent oxidoreductase (luciferase family)